MIDFTLEMIKLFFSSTSETLLGTWSEAFRICINNPDAVNTLAKFCANGYNLSLTILLTLGIVTIFKEYTKKIKT